MLKAAFPGSFDPPTLGHLNIIKRASGLFDELLVVIAENRQKKYLFSAKEREAMLRRLTSDYGNVKVAVCDTLIVDFLQKEGIKIQIRGVRGMVDFPYEFEISMTNKVLNPGIETIFMTTDPEFLVMRSSSIREIASFHGDVSGMVPPLVAEALTKKYRS